MAFPAPDPDFRRRVEESFGRQSAMETLGFRLMSVAPGHAAIGLNFSPRLGQQHGFIHAGVITTGLDSACGYAAFTLMPREAAVLSVEFKVNLLAPAKGESFVMRGDVIKPGRTITVCEGKAFALSNGVEKLIATMSATMMTVLGRADVQG